MRNQIINSQQRHQNHAPYQRVVCLKNIRRTSAWRCSSRDPGSRGAPRYPVNICSYKCVLYPPPFYLKHFTCSTHFSFQDRALKRIVNRPKQDHLQNIQCLLLTCYKSKVISVCKNVVMKAYISITEEKNRGFLTSELF